MNNLAALFQNLHPYHTEILIAVLVGIVLIILCILLLLRASRKTASQAGEKAQEASREPGQSEEAAEEGGTHSPRLNLSRTFRRALRVLRNNVSGRYYRYTIPWFAIIGESGSGKTTVLEEAGLDAFTAQTVADPDALCRWHFFDQGIMLDVKGEEFGGQEDKSSGHDQWIPFLRLLLKHRPERPLDGMVITVPSTDFFGPQDKTAERLHRINSRATRMYDRIRKAQKTLGMRCPLYILITKCDRIPGFQEFCRPLPDLLHNQMFGWSNPYALETAYSPEWLPQAFAEISADLQQLQSELFAHGVDARVSDGLFVFPAHFQTLAEGLQAYLDRVFKKSAYHESYLFRGIYFCGESGTEQRSPAQGSICFLRDLFQKKLFPESGLARPAGKQFINRNRTILAIQGVVAALILVWGFGLWWSVSSVSRDKNALLPTLHDINSGLEVIEGKAKVDQHFFTKETMNLVDGMSRTSLSDFSSFFMPLSWVDPLKEDTVNALAIAYDQFFMKSLLLKTQGRARQLVSSRPALSDADGPPPAEAVPVQKTAAFIALRDYVQRIRELEKAADNYNYIRRSQGEDVVADLSELTSYLFDQELPQKFYDFFQLYNDAIAKHTGKSLTLQPFQDPAKTRLEYHFQQLYHQLFKANPLSAYLDVLSIQLENFAGQSRNALKDRQSIENILQTIEKCNRLLSDPDLAWITSPGLELGRPFSELLARIDQSELLGREVRTRLEQAGENALKKFRFQLKMARAPLTGPLLFQDNGRLELLFSENLVQLADEFRTLLKQEFMVFKPNQSTSLRVPEGMRFIWNIPLLEEAVAKIAPYENFIRQGLKGFPKDLRALIKTTAKDSFNQSLLNLLIEAQSTSTASGRMLSRPREADLRFEIDNFHEASKLLDRLLVAFERLGLVNLYLNLTEIVGWQASTLLNAVDLLFKQQGLYTVKDGDLSWWSGKAPLGFMAYEVGDTEELRYYLDLQRKRVKHLAYQYAEPIISFFMNRSLPQEHSRTRIFSKWERILTSLNQYENKQPDNPVTRLERLILFEMQEITAGNYRDVLPPDCPGRPSGDFFVKTRNTLCRMIVERSKRLTAHKVLDNYQGIHTYFKEHLAGRFPFADPETAKPGKEAEPGAIRGLFRLLEAMPTSGLHILQEHDYFGLSGEKALDFFAQLKKLQEFFAPFVHSDPEETRTDRLPVYDFRVELRVNTDFEQGGHRIIDWLFTVAGQEFTRQDEPAFGRWRFGDPISLRLRWAKDSPVYPQKTETDDRVQVDDRTLRYDFTGKWSLLRLLRSHPGSVEDFAGLADAKPHTLKFQFDNAWEERYAGRGLKEQTRIYIRITPLLPDEKQGVPLIMPEHFPEYAPRLELKEAG